MSVAASNSVPPLRQRLAAVFLLQAAFQAGHGGNHVRGGGLQDQELVFPQPLGRRAPPKTTSDLGHRLTLVIRWDPSASRRSLSMAATCSSSPSRRVNPVEIGVEQESLGTCAERAQGRVRNVGLLSADRQSLEVTGRRQCLRRSDRATERSRQDADPDEARRQLLEHRLDDLAGKHVFLQGVAVDEERCAESADRGGAELVPGADTDHGQVGTAVLHILDRRRLVVGVAVLGRDDADLQCAVGQPRHLVGERSHTLRVEGVEEGHDQGIRDGLATDPLASADRASGERGEARQDDCDAERRVVGHAAKVRRAAAPRHQGSPRTSGREVQGSARCTTGDGPVTPRTGPEGSLSAPQHRTRRSSS